MTIVLMIACVIALMFIRAHLADSGAVVRSRSSFRHQRRRARKLGIPPESLEVRPRSGSVVDWGEPAGDSHVADLSWNFKLAGVGLVTLIIGFVLLPVKFAFYWIAVVLLGMLIVSRRRRDDCHRL